MVNVGKYTTYTIHGWYEIVQLDVCFRFQVAIPYRVNQGHCSGSCDSRIELHKPCAVWMIFGKYIKFQHSKHNKYTGFRAKLVLGLSFFK